MKKRIVTMFAVVLFTLLMSNSIFSATSGKCGDNITWTLDDNWNLVLNGSGKMYDYTSFGPWGTNVTTVKISDGITSIGNRAFRICFYMTQIEIPKSVTSIGDAAFYGCI